MGPIVSGAMSRRVIRIEAYDAAWPDRFTHIHVRKLGSFSQQFPLLLRDYLRAHPAELAPYEDLKRELAARHPHDGAAYTEAKIPWFWQTIRRADTWSQQTGWEPIPSDA